MLWKDVDIFLEGPKEKKKKAIPLGPAASKSTCNFLFLKKI